MINTEIAFIRQQIDAAYVNSLVDLINACRELDVKIDKVFHYQHGWMITFKGFRGDAICHNGSYGSPCYGDLHNPSIERNDWDKDGQWDTFGFPWDNGDVSVHSAEELAFYLWSLVNGKTPWENNENY